MAVGVDKSTQLEQHDRAYQDFVSLIGSLTREQFLRRRNAWAPRDVVAHLIGWNRNIRAGCDQIFAGQIPFYHADAPNDYRTLNAGFTARYDSMESDVLLRELADAARDLRTYFEAVDQADWSRDFGPRHYRGGPATIGRCAESITREYVEHGRDIAAGL
jgi:hypothetical protein